MKETLALIAPSGVGETTPAFAPFKDAAEAAQLFSTYSVNANESISAIGRNFALMEILDRLVNARAKEDAESVGTPAVARDMLSIVNAFGQDKLQYWGVS